MNPLGIGPNYSNGVAVSSNIDGSDIQGCINGFMQSFRGLLWTLISSFPGASGTTGYIVKSVKTPINEIQCQVKFFYNSGASFKGPTVDFYIADGFSNDFHAIGSLTIEPNKIFRMILGPYQFFVLVDDNDINIEFGSLNNVMGGVPVIKNPALGQMAYWGMGESSQQHTFRTSLAPFVSPFYYNINGITPGNFPILLTMRGTALEINVGFEGGVYYPLMVPMLVLGSNVLPKLPVVVSLWDSYVWCNGTNEKILSNADDHQWESYTLGGIGTLFLATGTLVTGLSGGFSY